MQMNTVDSQGRFYAATKKSSFDVKKCTIFEVKNSTYFTFYVGHFTRQGISLLRMSNRITAMFPPKPLDTLPLEVDAQKV